ncbi:MAG: tripartite tricarboxylate transporter permease [Thermodesulfobacteriota bacterium]
MDTINYLVLGFSTILTVTNLIASFSGILVGTFIGVLPGLGPTATMAILLPLTFGMDATPAIIMIAGIYYGSQYGGSTTSILVNIPGEVGSIVTCLDGYQMARQGRAGAALGMSAMGSFIGGTVGVIGLMFLAPFLGEMAANLGPADIFSFIVFGLMMVSSIGKGSLAKALIMATLGIFVSTIGRESMQGFSRFTLGSLVLSDGVGIVPAAVGMFGLTELLGNIEEMAKQEVFKTKLRDLFPSLKDWKASFWPVIRGTFVGFFFGIVPGAGTLITTFFSYGLEKRLSKHPETFGTGAIEGVAGPETANNASTAGSMVPLLVLGVPPHQVMAMLMAAFIIHGIQPSPYLIADYPNLFWGLIASMYLGNVMLLLLNLPLIGVWVQLLKVPYRLLFPLIIIFCFVGVYSVNNNIYDLLIMILFGLIFYILRKIDYEPGPFILALVLGPMMETNFRQSMKIAGGDPAIFIQRPYSAFFLALVVVILVISLFFKRGKRKGAEDWT